MRLALGAFRARWANDIPEGWMSSLLASRPDFSRDQLDRTRTLINPNVRDCVVQGYRDLIDDLDLPDPNDRHVLAAAIRAHPMYRYLHSGTISRPRLAEYGIEAQHRTSSSSI
jgi:hypothetical protein